MVIKIFMGSKLRIIHYKDTEGFVDMNSDSKDTVEIKKKDLIRFAIEVWRLGILLNHSR